MTGFYGQPKVLITIVNVTLGAAGHGRRTYTYEEVGVRVKVFRGASEVPLEPTNHARMSTPARRRTVAGSFKRRQASSSASL